MPSPNNETKNDDESKIDDGFEILITDEILPQDLIITDVYLVRLKKSLQSNNIHHFYLHVCHHFSSPIFKSSISLLYNIPFFNNTILTLISATDMQATSIYYRTPRLLSPSAWT